MDLTLTRPVEVRGVVAFAPDTSLDDSPQETVGGLLIATAPGVVPGTQLRSEAVVQARQKVGEEWTFVLRVLPGVSYTVTFVPADDPARGPLAQLPTHVFTAQFAQSQTGFQVLLFSKKEYLDASVQGVVFLDEAGTQPVRSARVSSAASGMKGTTAVTDDKGVFRVIAPPGTGPLTLRIEPGKDAPLFPIREFLYEGGVSELTSLAVPRFVVGPVPATREILVQVFSVVGQTLTPVPQALVEADGRAGDGLASGYSVTGSDGVARLVLLEGVYALSVVPPEGSPYAARVSALDLVANPDATVFHVPLSERATVKGTVVREDNGRPVPGAVVTLQSERLQAFEGSPIAPREVTAGAQTDADGAFEVAVDPGVYAVTVIPPASSGLARFGQPGVDLTGGDATMTVRLRAGSLVRGQVVAAGSGSVPGAKVELFLPVSRGDAEPTFAGASFASSLQTVGSAVTDAAGRFSVVVPDTGVSGSETFGPDAGEAPKGFGLPAVEVFPSRS